MSDFFALIAVLAGVSGCSMPALAAGVAVGLLVVWLALYLSVSVPINRQLTAAPASRSR